MNDHPGDFLCPTCGRFEADEDSFDRLAAPAAPEAEWVGHRFEGEHSCFDANCRGMRHELAQLRAALAAPGSVETAGLPLLDPVLVRAGLRATSLPCNCHPKIVLGEIVEERDDKHVNEFIAGVLAALSPDTTGTP